MFFFFSYFKSFFFQLNVCPKAVEIDDELQNIYWECEQKCRKYTRRFGYFVFFHTSTFTIVLIYALVRIAFGNYDTSSWHLPFFMLFPFDQNHVWGWLMTWFMQAGLAFCYAASMTSITSYFVSCCCYLIAMLDHFNLLIHSLINNVKSMQMEENPRKIEKMHVQIITQLCNIIKFQVKIYE